MTCCGRLSGKINLSMIKKYKELNKDGKLKEKGTLIDGVKQGRFFAYEYFDKTEPKKQGRINQPGKRHRVHPRARPRHAPKLGRPREGDYSGQRQDFD